MAQRICGTSRGAAVAQGTLMSKPRAVRTNPEFVLDHGATVPLYQQLFERLRAQILAGRLAARTRLPSTRVLASMLGISRNTSARAYEQLLLEGYVESKVLSPALRIGHLVAPPVLLDGLRAMRRMIDIHPPVLEQIALADFISEGHFARHVRKMRLVYGERRDALVDGLTRELGGALDVTVPEAGIHLASARLDETTHVGILLNLSANAPCLEGAARTRRCSPRQRCTLAVRACRDAR
jgi:DNA-binding transcriptional MocR family regulator